mgnify:CR=1 FL=1
MALLSSLFEEGEEKKPLASFKGGIGPHLVSVIQGMDSVAEPPRWGLHVSSLLRGICPRKEFLAVVYPKHQSSARVGSGDRILWAMGRAAENHCRTSYITAAYNDNSIPQPYGVWACPKCGCQAMGFRPSGPNSICICGSGGWDYQELKLEWNGVVGSPDFVLVDDVGDFHVIEFKSINTKGFAALDSAPSLEHCLQVSAYGKMLRNQGHPVRSLTVVYVCKDYMFKSPFKTFDVEVDRYNAELELMWEDAAIVTGAISTKQLPIRIPACASPNHPRAKMCAACSLCFSLK